MTPLCPITPQRTSRLALTAVFLGLACAAHSVAAQGITINGNPVGAAAAPTAAPPASTPDAAPAPSATAAAPAPNAVPSKPEAAPSRAAQQQAQESGQIVTTYGEQNARAVEEKAKQDRQAASAADAPAERIPPHIEKAPPTEEDAVTTYDYQGDQIYPVRAGLGITTEIELSPSEKILDYSTGFSSGWDLTRRDNVFYLKPKNVDVDTNMMIRTETHSYIFELKVVATDWRTLAQARRAGVQYHIRFTYPADAAFAKAVVRTEHEPELSTALLKDRSYNFDYDYATKDTDSPWLIPVNVWDDGRFTYIKMPDLSQFPTGNFPTIYMRDFERSQDSLVNTTVQGNTIVVHGTYNYLILRHDDKIIALRRNTDK